MDTKRVMSCIRAKGSEKERKGNKMDEEGAWNARREGEPQQDL